MPRVFDNITLPLLPALKASLEVGTNADFCVGYFNLRGWRDLGPIVENWPGGDGKCCRVLVGMQPPPDELLRRSLSIAQPPVMDQQEVARLRKKMAEDFRRQLTFGAPTNDDEGSLQQLAGQLRVGKVIVKLFLRHPLHAKLYLVHREDANSPTIGFLGSSNLTLSGLVKQGELNIDVLDHDACEKLQRWFDDRWKDPWCLDISEDLADAIEESWARSELVDPYLIYLKIAFHLSREAQTAVSEFRVPADFGDRLFEFQTKAVQIAAHHLNKRHGVLIGDVVGLGKTLMATAVARIFQDDQRTETLIICPKNLVPMWQDYVHRYRLVARVLPSSLAIRELPNTPRYRVVVIDESHNFRNKDGRIYRAIADYIERNDSDCVLLSATPYNKTYLDLSAQLGLFLSPDRDLGIRPEAAIRDIGEVEFIRRHQCSPRTLAGFEKSDFADDWRDLMRLYMVRRTRGFIKENYAFTDPENGRKYLLLDDGERSYFPERVPRTVPFTVNIQDPNDQYARLFSPGVINTVAALTLSRYGLGNYLDSAVQPTPAESVICDALGRAGQRLIGYCVTNLFKRLESGGPAFIQSLERHILRNFVFVHAIENGRDLPIGTQDAELLEPANDDEDADSVNPRLLEDEDDDTDRAAVVPRHPRTEAEFRALAAEVYASYATSQGRRFRWLRPGLFRESLRADLLRDALALLAILRQSGEWDPDNDAKLNALHELITKTHPGQKILVFSQFADTVRYLTARLKERGVRAIEGVTGDSDDPTTVAWRFSPESNDRRALVSSEREIRVLIATDVLSEGQNLQDAAIAVNFDLPWALVRLVQRGGRIDRIGQKASEILCYSFLPADGVEQIIALRARVFRRLHENAEVVGSDEKYFEDQAETSNLYDIYNEKAGIFDGETDTEVDLASLAYQIWRNATEENPALKRAVEMLPDVVYSSRAHAPRANAPEGVLVYVRTKDDADALAWIDREGRSVTQSQLRILEAAACKPDTPPQERHPLHHDLVQQGVKHILEEEKSVGGQLGRPSGARFKTYERLKRYIEVNKGSLFATPDLERAVEDIYRYPLRPLATDALNRQLRAGIGDDALADLVVSLRSEGRLSVIEDDADSTDEPRIICSLGLFSPGGD
jgi:hypothetical protein